MVHLRHHSLVAWQRGDDLFINLHKLTLESFPSFERYELGSQLIAFAPRRGSDTSKNRGSQKIERDLSQVGAPLSGLIRSLQSATTDET